MAASCRFTIEETVDRFQGRNLKETTVTTRDVVVPAWIDRSAIPSDRISITGTELLDFRADMWLSVTELRRSNLGIYCAKGHGYEWLACGAIPKSRIVKIMPYDGEGLHQFRATWIVHSTRSVLDWVFDWSTNMWKIDHEMAKLARLQKKISDMRKRKVGPEILEERPKKRRKSKANAKRTANAAKNAGRVEDNDIDSRSEAVTKTKSRKTIADESMLVSALLLA